jgi:arginyl-tRNA--protein-N-Asp/Glu arginylyltransferase
MFVHMRFQHRLAPERYDQFLAAGWFRGASMLYRMDLMCIDGAVNSVINVRLPLAGFTPDRRQRKLISRVERRLRVVVRPADPVPDSAREKLYALHRSRFRGHVHATLHEFFTAGQEESAFDTWEVGIYDGEELVGMSFFDAGSAALASLLAAFHPDYSAYSLGTYTLLREIAFAQETGRSFFYPGYILDRTPLFDYKLRLGSMEFLGRDRVWHPYGQFRAEATPGADILRAMEALEDRLRRAGIGFRRWLYPGFALGHLARWEGRFVRLPVFLELGADGCGTACIGFLNEPGGFECLRMAPSPESAHWVNFELAEEFRDAAVYWPHLMEVVLLDADQASLEEAVQWATSWCAAPDALPILPSPCT